MSNEKKVVKVAVYIRSDEDLPLPYNDSPERRRFFLEKVYPGCSFEERTFCDYHNNGITQQRPQIIKLKEKVTQEEVDVIVTHSISMLAREHLHFIHFLRNCGKHKVKVICEKEKLVFDGINAMTIGDETEPVMNFVLQSIIFEEWG